MSTFFTGSPEKLYSLSYICLYTSQEKPFSKQKFKQKSAVILYMRITPAQVANVVSLCSAQLNYSPRIWLFGSCVLDEARGGDIDLLVGIQGKESGPWQRLAKAQGVELNVAFSDVAL
ncbi:hypothetical protein MASR2M78_02360 [Treponema sp.]